MDGNGARDAAAASAKCIYCLEQKPLAEFNREHVLHRAFGGFEEALTLVAPHDPGVCRACNDYFSPTVDLAITPGFDRGASSGRARPEAGNGYEGDAEPSDRDSASR